MRLSLLVFESLHFSVFSLVKEIKSAVNTNNINREEGPLRWGTNGIGTSIYFRDPEGDLIEARYYEDPNSSEKCLLGP